MHEQWLSEYGKTLIYNGFFGVSTAGLQSDVSVSIMTRNVQTTRLLTTDSRALTYVLNNAYDYPKPDITRVGLGRILGDGEILQVEPERHL